MRLLLTVLIMIFSLHTQAQWLLQPYMGLDYGIIDATRTQAPAGNYTINPVGFGLGARGGYTFADSWLVGMDFQYTLGGQLQMQSQPIGANLPSDNYTKLMLALTGGWQPSSSVRLILGILLLNDMTDQAGSGNIVFKGDGFRLGADFFISPQFAIGAYYDYQNFTKYDEAGASNAIGTRYSKFSSNNFHFNCSFPFAF